MPHTLSAAVLFFTPEGLLTLSIAEVVSAFIKADGLLFLLERVQHRSNVNLLQTLSLPKLQN